MIDTLVKKDPYIFDFLEEIAWPLSNKNVLYGYNAVQKFKFN